MALTARYRVWGLCAGSVWWLISCATGLGHVILDVSVRVFLDEININGWTE